MSFYCKLSSIMVVNDFNYLIGGSSIFLVTWVSFFFLYFVVDVVLLFFFFFFVVGFLVAVMFALIIRPKSPNDLIWFSMSCKIDPQLLHQIQAI